MKIALTVLSAAVLLYAGGLFAQAQYRQTERFEVSSLKAVRPTLEKTIAALQKQDIAGAKEAFEAYDAGWNGIEMYINRRYPAVYTELERNYQDKIEKALGEPNPNTQALAADVRAMLAKYDETIGMIEKAVPLSPLYDDVARIRIVRADLRPIAPALKAGDVAKARKSFDAFHHNWEGIEEMVATRSRANFEVIENGVHGMMAAFAQPKPDIDQLSKLVAEVMSKYNLALAEVYKEAQASK